MVPVVEPAEINLPITTTEPPISELMSFSTNPLILLYLSEKLNPNKDECAQLYTYMMYRSSSPLRFRFPPFLVELEKFSEEMGENNFTAVNDTEFNGKFKRQNKYECFEILRKWDTNLINKDLETIFNTNYHIDRTMFVSKGKNGRVN